MSFIKAVLPEYELLLPITGKRVRYRPFTVAEEKILLLAQEEGNIDAYIRGISQILRECTFGAYTTDTLNKIDAEYLFIHIRNRSLGEGVEIYGICDCGGKTPLVMNLDRITIRKTNIKDSIQLADDMWVTMKLPTMKESLEISENQGDKGVAVCLDTIILGENSYNASEFTIEERTEFIDSLSPLQLKKFDEFFKEFPVVEFDFEYNCSKCSKKNNIHIEGIDRFFL